MKPEDVAPPWLLAAGPGPGRMQALVHGHGAVQTLRCADLTVNALPASALEAGPANLWLRCWEDDGSITPVPLLGPAAPGRAVQRAGRRWHQGQWRGLHYRVMLRLAKTADAWFWHVALHNPGGSALRLDLVLVQDLALAPWASLRLNEAYVSQYLDHHPLHHPVHGWAIATRQNAAVQGRHPWLLCASLGNAVAYATDGLQLLGRGGAAGAGLLDRPLPSSQLQHEHGLAALQEQAFELAPGQSTRHGFFGCLLADHAAASGPDDLAQLDLALALPESRAPEFDALDAQAEQADSGDDPRNLFSSAPHWPAQTPTPARLEAWFEPPWRHVEVDAQGQVLSFFRAEQAHVITAHQAHRLLRPPGHILRSGRHATPVERAVASTVWMAGVFHSSLTQGHASANRCLSTQRGYLGQFRALGLRLFVDAGAGWRLLDLPSAFAMTPDQACWRYADGLHELELVATAGDHDPTVSLSLQVHAGPPLAVLASLHLALGSVDSSDDGLSEAAVPWQQIDGPPLALAPGQSGISARWHLAAPAGSNLAQRFGDGGGAGGLALQCDSDAATLALLGDEALFLDGRSRRLPYHCIRLSPLRRLSLTLTCTLVLPAPASALNLSAAERGHSLGLRWSAPATPAGAALGQLADWLPWLQHNAMVHYLSPRGLEQFSGGGWGTRDVCQGPAELLLALGRLDVLRDLLCRVFSAQNTDGDWPQWFMFFPRDAHMRADDAHGDIVFWPLVALSDYLLASGDASLLDQPLPFYGHDQLWPLAEHVLRALAVIQQRRIAGTALAAYGHGDWNDALQPADPAMREQLCSAWTVTLHHRMLRGLAAAWRQLGLSHPAQGFADQADAVEADFQRLLVVDGVVAGYASFDRAPRIDYLLHPRDARTGIRYSALPMVHAILDELFTPEQAAAHAALIEGELTGPDGLRLFDAPLRYAGGPMALFQRGESASYFGREIGLMYMHAHLRWAEALARLGRADALLRALQLANPIALQALVPQAAPRQRNCYYSSSDAGFASREQASRDYHRLAEGDVALEGGWRIYSSGAGIAYRLVVQQLLGLQQRHNQLGIDPVLPAGPQGLDGLEVQIELYGQPVVVRYRVGQLGHGPLAVSLNGVALALVPGSNRYRKAGVWVDNAALVRPPHGNHHQLDITLA